MRYDFIVSGEYVLTMDDKRPLIKHGAVAVKGRRIAAVGRAAEISKAGRPERAIDAGRALIMPGLINAHTHAAMAYFRGLADDLPLKDWLENHVWPAEAKYVNPKFARESSRLAILEMIKSGITCFNDMYFFEEETAAVAEAAGIRAVLGEGILDFATPSCDRAARALAKTAALARDFKKSGLLSAAFAPHSVYTCAEELLLTVREEARRLDLPLHIHLSETKQEVLECLAKHGLSPVAYADKLGLLSERTLIAHAVWVDDNDLSIIKARRCAVCHNPKSNLKLASGIAPVMRMSEAGITLGLGTDGAASNNTLDLFSEMRAAALIHKAAASDPTALPAAEVLKMATRGGARALGKEKELGSLQAGKLADLITINLDRPHLSPLYDPFSQLVYCAGAADVNNVIINGRVIMRNREVLTMDEERVLKEARAFAKRM
jgi:5-methylthioadenosine/S-adenosylhomocysteine deaminase